MPKYPILKPIDLIKILHYLGFEQTRQKCSHIIFKHKDGRSTTVPFHKGRDLSPLLLKQILKEISVDLEEFKKFL